MSSKSRYKQSRNQWKTKAVQRSQDLRYLKKQNSRIKMERDQSRKDLKETRARLRQLEARGQVIVFEHKVDLVFLALQLFLVARIGFRAVSRVLGVVAEALGIKKKSHAPKLSSTG